jgi:hypothetical protein
MDFSHKKPEHFGGPAISEVLLIRRGFTGLQDAAF